MWNSDITTAPRGKEVTITETVKGELRERSEYRHEWVWLATSEGNVVRTRWLPPSRFTKAGRWDGFSENSQIILAWQPYEVPVHPGLMTRSSAIDELIASSADELFPPASGHFILDDVGGGA